MCVCVCVRAGVALKMGGLPSPRWTDTNLLTIGVTSWKPLTAADELVSGGRRGRRGEEVVVVVVVVEVEEGSGRSWLRERQQKRLYAA